MRGPYPTRRLQSLAIIGAGSRGLAFAERCLAAGYPVVLEDVLSSKLRQAEEKLGKYVVSNGLLRLASGVEDAVRDADLAIDFVPDELESKLEILSMMDRMAPPRTLFCTPTLLSISDLQACTYRAGQCVGLRPFGEEPEAGVHLVRGRATAEGTTAIVMTWLQSLGFSVESSMDQQPPPG